MDAAVPQVLTTLADGVATLTLNRPGQLNTLSGAMLAALQHEIDALAGDDAVRCVVIAAQGRAFCAGHDLNEMRALDGEEALKALFARCSRLMLSLRALPVPVIAKVQGPAVAAGCQLVAACDLAVAAGSARFAVSGIDLGLFCSTPAVALTRAIPIKPALDMLLTGRVIDAAEAQALGLVNRIAPDDGLDAAVDGLTAAICAKDRDAVRLGKRMVYAQMSLGLEEAYGLAGEVMACNMMNPGTRAGIDAFLDRH